MGFNYFKEKFLALDKQQKVYVLVLLFVVFPLLAIISNPKIETGYTRVAEKVCKSENKCVSYKMFEPILVSEYSSDKFQVWNDKKESIGTISKKNVIFEGTPEYEQTKQEKAEYEKILAEAAKKLEAKQLAEKQAKLATLEPKMKKAYVNIELKPTNTEGIGFYNFYVHPNIWFKLNYKEKENAFNTCVTYTQLKINSENVKAIKPGVKIKSSTNAVTLAEYDTFKGIKLK